MKAAAESTLDEPAGHETHVVSSSDDEDEHKKHHKKEKSVVEQAVKPKHEKKKKASSSSDEKEDKPLTKHKGKETETSIVEDAKKVFCHNPKKIW